MRKGWLKGRQLKKGMPWQIDITEEEIAGLKTKVQRKSPPKMRAS
jgi:hypothetical protein